MVLFFFWPPPPQGQVGAGRAAVPAGEPSTSLQIPTWIYWGIPGDHPCGNFLMVSLRKFRGNVGEFSVWIFPPPYPVKYFPRISMWILVSITIQISAWIPSINNREISPARGGVQPSGQAIHVPQTPRKKMVEFQGIIPVEISS